MRAARGRRALACAAAAAALGAAARADDAPPPPPAPADSPAEEKPKVEGDVRVGWRFLSDEGDGRFQQDVGLKEGFRLFDFNALATGLGAKTPIDEAEAHVSGAGDRDSDWLLSVRKRDLLDISGGYRRDDSVYSASGDIFPLDDLRQRTFFHATVTPDRSFAVRLSWDRTTQTVDWNGAGFSDLLQPPPTGSTATYQESLPRSVRSTWLTDDFTGGFDWSPGIFRFGFTQSVRLGQTQDDSNIYATQSGQQLHDAVDQSSRLWTYSSTGKAGVTLFDRKLDVTLFVTRIESPLKARANGDSLGLDADGNPVSNAFHTDSELRREDLDWRLETSWRPHKDWEFTASAERGNRVDDESVDLEGAATFAQRGSAQYRITDRTQRWAGDVTWDATDELRLRAGEQYLYEDVFDPSYSHFAEITGTDFSSASWRTTAGADWTAKSKVWSLSALAHHSTNDEPHTTPIPDSADDWSLRGRWKPSTEFTTTLYWRHVAARHSGAVQFTSLGQPVDPNFGDRPGDSTDLGSATRSDSVSASGAWTHDAWTVTGSGTLRTFDTTADTAFGRRVNAQDPTDPTATTFRRILETVGFSGQDVIANLDVHYAFTKTLRAFTNTAVTDATCDYTARWVQVTVGGEYDLRKDLTLGVTVSTWRLNEEHSAGDNYRTYGAEVSLTYRF
jgi:hypothetical protein